jgi:two-component system phosphate regulon sensor histidine kinase PhoR
MTHEFKTPLATISLAVDAMRNEKVLTDREKLNYFSGIIKEENKRMNQQVETILQAALLEKQELQLNLHPQHVHEVLNRVLDNFALQLEEKMQPLSCRTQLDGVEPMKSISTMSSIISSITPLNTPATTSCLKREHAKYFKKYPCPH